MPLPRIREGRKLSLMLPADVVARIKTEALKRGTIPALVILEALDAYWGGISEASYPTIPHTNAKSKLPKQEERRALGRMYRHLERLMTEGSLTIAEVAAASGLREADIRDGWAPSGIVPKAYLEAVIRLLARKKLPVMPGR